VAGFGLTGGAKEIHIHRWQTLLFYLYCGLTHQALLPMVFCFWLDFSPPVIPDEASKWAMYGLIEGHVRAKKAPT
jgi:hypothetical protein